MGRFLQSLLYVLVLLLLVLIFIMPQAGYLKLFPPIIAIILAISSRNVISSLMIGVFSGAILLALNDDAINGSLISVFINSFFMVSEKIRSSLADSWNAGIVLQVFTIGGLIALMSYMSGIRAIATALAKLAKTSKSTQLTTWLMGFIVFFDDYANTLVVGPIMRPIADKMRISREKLAFIVDATAAPIAGLAIISTWISFELGTIKDGFSDIALEVSPFVFFLDTIPYRFYNFLILFFIVATVFLRREYGPMYKAEMNTMEGKGSLYDEAGQEEVQELKHEHNIAMSNRQKEPSIWDAIVPLMVLIVGAFVIFYYSGKQAIEDEALLATINEAPFSLFSLREIFGNADASIALFQAALLATIVTLIWGMLRGHFNIAKGVNVWAEGWKSLVFAVIILLLAWTLTGIIKELETGKYLADFLSSRFSYILIPATIFIFGAMISFATGTSYGTMGILMPIAIVLSHGIIENTANFPMDNMHFIVLSGSAVLSGAIFGDHCSPISDTTILSSTATSCDLIAHVKTQLPYSITVAIISIFLYIMAALDVLHVSLLLLIGATSVVAMLFIFGKKVPNHITNN